MIPQDIKDLIVYLSDCYNTEIEVLYKNSYSN